MLAGVSSGYARMSSDAGVSASCSVKWADQSSVWTCKALKAGEEVQVLVVELHCRWPEEAAWKPTPKALSGAIGESVRGVWGHWYRGKGGAGFQHVAIDLPLRQPVEVCIERLLTAAREHVHDRSAELEEKRRSARDVMHDMKLGLERAGFIFDPNADEVHVGAGRLRFDAQEFYVAYGKATDFKNFQGNPMPAWGELPQRIRDAWQAVADAAQRAHDDFVDVCLP